jgi:hypothetical protein
MKSQKWVAINNACGDWGVIGQFSTKAKAVDAVQMFEGTDARPNKWGEIGNHTVMKIEDALVQFDGIENLLQ